MKALNCVDNWNEAVEWWARVRTIVRSGVEFCAMGRLLFCVGTLTDVSVSCAKVALNT